MIPTPALLQAQAAEHNLGDCLQRYRRRPGVVGAFFAFAPLVGGLLLVIRVGDAAGALGIVLFVWPPVFLTWCVSTRRRLDGGLYVFTGGFAEVHGRKVRYAIPWARVREVRYKGIEYWMGFFPVGYSAKCLIALRNGGAIELDGTYRTLMQLAEVLHTRSWLS